MTDAFWMTDHHLEGGACVIVVVRAEDHPAACEAFGLERFSPRAHACTTPDILAQMRDVPPGELVWMQRPRPPSAYDRFGYGSGCPMDFQAMKDAGWDTH